MIKSFDWIRMLHDRSLMKINLKGILFDFDWFRILLFTNGMKGVISMLWKPWNNFDASSIERASQWRPRKCVGWLSWSTSNLTLRFELDIDGQPTHFHVYIGVRVQYYWCPATRWQRSIKVIFRSSYWTIFMNDLLRIKMVIDGRHQMVL